MIGIEVLVPPCPECGGQVSYNMKPEYSIFKCLECDWFKLAINPLYDDEILDII